MERMTISVMSNVGQFDAASLSGLASQIKDYLETFLAENEDLKNVLNENGMTIAQLFGAKQDGFLERHLSYLAEKYAFRIYLLRSPQQAADYSLQEIDVDWSEYDESRRKIILMHHYGRYFQVTAKLTITLAESRLPVALAARRKAHVLVRGSAESVWRLSDKYGGGGILTHYEDIVRFLQQDRSTLVLFCDHADFEVPSHNHPFAFYGDAVIYLHSATDSLIRHTGCRVFLATNLSEFGGPIRILPASQDTPTQDAISYGLARDMEIDCSRWDRIKYFNRLSKA